MRAVVDNPRTLVRSAHGIGKSHLASRLIAWVVCTNPPGDYFTVVSAPSWDQLRSVIWRYLTQLHAEHNLPGFIGQDCTWKIGNEMVALGRKPADHDSAGLQGIHARRGVFAIGDEGCGLADQIWTAMDTLTTTAESRTLIIGNPDTTASRFYKAATGIEPGWHTIKISAFDSPLLSGETIPEEMKNKPGLVDPTWVQDKAERWGIDSALYRIKVEAEFADDDAQVVIPADWVRAAQIRWSEWHSRDDVTTGARQPAGPTTLGVDVAGQGKDKTVIATLKGDVVEKLESWDRTDTVQIVDHIAARLAATVQGTAIIDSIGIGAGVLDLARNRGLRVRPFIASAATTARDNTGTQKFFNVRAQAWWWLRERLDPARNPTLCLPPNDDLLRDLTAPRWEAAPGARIKIESKDEVRKRLTRSPDLADAVIAATWHAHPDGASTLEPWERPEPLRAIQYALRGGTFEPPDGYIPGQWS